MKWLHLVLKPSVKEKMVKNGKAQGGQPGHKGQGRPTAGGKTNMRLEDSLCPQTSRLVLLVPVESLTLS